MRTLKNIENRIKKFCETKKSSVATSDEMDKKILNDALAVYEKCKTTESANLQPKIWRILMKSKITKLSAAAAIIILAVLGIWFLKGIVENDLEPKTRHGNDIVVKKPEDRPIVKSPGALNSNDPVEIPGKSLAIKDSSNSSQVASITSAVKPDRITAAAGAAVVAMDRKRINAEAKKIREMAAVGDIDGLVAMLSIRVRLRSNVIAAEYLGEIGDERAIKPLLKLQDRYVCGLRRDGSTKFRKDGYGYVSGMSSGAFPVAICKITTRNLSVEEQIDAWFELLDEYIEPEMDPDKPFLAIGRELLDVPINKYGFGCLDLGKRVAAELEKYDDPSIVTRLRKSENKGAAITAVWMEIQDMPFEKAIERCVEIAKNEHEAQQYGAIKCLGRLGEVAVLALDELALEGHYEAMRTLGYLKKNPEVLKIMCWHFINNETYLVRLLAISHFSFANIERYQQPILLQTMIEALYDTDKRIRGMAVSLLRTIAKGKKGSELLEYEDDLLLALEHPDKKIRSSIAQTLKILDSKRLHEVVPGPPEIRSDLR